MKWSALALAGLMSACSSGTIVATSAGPDGSTGAPPPLTDAGPPACADAAVPPSTLACAGLYADLATKQLASGVRPYAPAVPFWSDGAGKDRWIALPAGTKIDATVPGEWSFPVGTKLFKEFALGGKRLETRLFEKISPTLWVHATYAWNADESVATRSFGQDVALADGGTWHIPSPTDCDQCHRGRTDRILGFEEVSLGLPGATGLTLSALVAEGLVSPAPARTDLTIGDDGTGAAPPALAWLHINCGTTCHNANSNATAYAAGMHLRLDPAQLDGRSSLAFEARRTTVGVAVVTASWVGQTRIAPGDPGNSLLAHLISSRGAQNQMPPLATTQVDVADVALVETWIRKMAPADAGAPDAGPRDAGVDAEADAGVDANADAEADAQAAADAQVGADAGADAQADADAGADASADAHAAPDAPID